jgi:hypothetical protein
MVSDCPRNSSCDWCLILVLMVSLMHPYADVFRWCAQVCFSGFHLRFHGELLTQLLFVETAILYLFTLNSEREWVLLCMQSVNISTANNWCLKNHPYTINPHPISSDWLLTACYVCTKIQWSKSVADYPDLESQQVKVVATIFSLVVELHGGFNVWRSPNVNHFLSYSSEDLYCSGLIAEPRSLGDSECTCSSSRMMAGLLLFLE